ncbi:hypothetical protein CEUSTIGMA_g4214.t1 [Chlamydomonas eustigma]|uniref:Uncharacterized protein n=1 Tax=Chlamydomonas eustigma TaxID=1157962 RepID=A0A250X114_9CHLO|nr:hypothetical protein CEUSTIGMA_g4214.t1 [Chlamydomonas eustigma]|eukprot:GAX76767.1 hypothetical protein CEUSTIGMA_g4214.t1 [Chlamydomonas eustigma]
MIGFLDLCPCFGGKFTHNNQNFAHERPEIPETLLYEDDISLLFFASKEQKILAAQRVTAAAGGPEPLASQHRQELLSRQVLSALEDMLKQSKTVRAAAVQAICNLALEAASGTADAAERQASAAAAARTANQTPDIPAWNALLNALSSLVPLMTSLLINSDFSDGPVLAAHTLANLMRGSAFVSRVLNLLGPLPDLAKQLIITRSDPLVKQIFTQMMLNAALHTGTASALDTANAQAALLLLLEDRSTPAAAQERCLCTLYNMIRGEESAGKRSNDLLSRPSALSVLCSQLLQPNPNCRFLCACLIMCLRRSTLEMKTESEWGQTDSLYTDEAGRGGERLLQRPRASYYRNVSRFLSEPQVLDALQHALASCLLNSSQGFTYGRREQLLQALVTCMHAVCSMEEEESQTRLDGQAGPAKTVDPSSTHPDAASRTAGPMSRRLAVQYSSTSSALSQQIQEDPQGSSAAAADAMPLHTLERLTLSTANKLTQLLTAPGGQGLDASLAESCLRLICLMTTRRATRKLLVAVPSHSTFSCLSAVVANTVHSRQSVRASKNTPTLTPRHSRQGSSPLTPTATSTAAAAIHNVGAAYMRTDFGGVDDAQVWGRCQALAAKALRNLSVSEPVPLLQYRNTVPSLLAALLGPPAPPSLSTQSAAEGVLEGGGGGVSTPQAEGSFDGLSPRPGISPRPRHISVVWWLGAEPDWLIEVQKNALAALIHLTAHPEHASLACSALVDSGGLPVIVEVMKLSSSETNSVHCHQLSAWCAALLCQLYVSPIHCQRELTEALVASKTAPALSLLAHPSVVGTGTSSMNRAPGYGPMYASLHKRSKTPASTSQSLMASRDANEAGGVNAAAVVVVTASSPQPFQKKQSNQEGLSIMTLKMGGKDEDTSVSAEGNTLETSPAIQTSLVLKGTAVQQASSQTLQDLKFVSSSTPYSTYLDKPDAEVISKGHELRTSLGLPPKDLAAQVRSSVMEMRESIGMPSPVMILPQAYTSSQREGSSMDGSVKTASGREADVETSGSSSTSHILTAAVRPEGLTSPPVQKELQGTAAPQGRQVGWSTSTKPGLSDEALMMATDEVMGDLERLVMACVPSFLDGPIMTSNTTHLEDDGSGAAMSALA